MEHKKVKWEVPLRTRRDGDNRCWVMQGKTSICRCFGKPKAAEVKAKLIVQCCNSHDGLVEALNGTDETPNVPMVLAQLLQGRRDVAISMLKELCSINLKALTQAKAQ